MNMHKIISFFKQEDGATAIEYGIIGAMMVVAILTAMSTTGSHVGNTYETIGDEVKKVMNK